MAVRWVYSPAAGPPGACTASRGPFSANSGTVSHGLLSCLEILTKNVGELQAGVRVGMV